MIAKEKNQTKSDIVAPERRIYAFPEGKWVEVKSDKIGCFHFVGEGDNSSPLGPLPYWVLRHNPPKNLTVADVRAICRSQLSKRGMARILSDFGPWEISPDTPSLIAIDFSSWHFEAVELRRAYHLLTSLRAGEVPRWKWAAKGFLRLSNWPRALQLVSEPKSSMLGFHGAISGSIGRQLNLVIAPDSQNAEDFETSEASRRLGKMLLAQFIDRGLRGVPLGFVFDYTRDTFCVDITEDVPLNLRAACWMTLRDLAAGLSGVRFCQAPGCRTAIPPEKNAGTKVCSGRCQQALYRRGKAGKNGQT